MWSTNYGCKIERYAGNGTPGNPYRYRVAAAYANRPMALLALGGVVMLVKRRG